MNLMDLLQSLQDFRSKLETWGVTTQTLLIAGGVAVLLFILSLREVLGWYLRMMQVRDEVRQLRAQMSEMQKTVNETRNLLLEKFDAELEPVEPAKKSATAKPESSPGNRFRFDH